MDAGPMSMTRGDFDADYLEQVVLGADGRPRLPRSSFAAHFDSLMRGRHGLPRPRSEVELAPYRQRFVDMCRACGADHGIPSYISPTT